MRLAQLLLTLTLISGCSDDSSDDGSQTGTDTDSSATTDPGDGTGTDTDDGQTDTPPAALELTAPSWELSDYMASLVIVSWDQSRDATAHVEYSFDTDEWHSSPDMDGMTGTNSQILVGIPFGIDVEWRVISEDITLDGDMATTGAIPEDLPLGELRIAEPDAWFEGGDFMLTSVNEKTCGWCGGTYWTFIMDRQGRPVWAHAGPNPHWTLFAQVSYDGSYFMWDEMTEWSFGGQTPESSIHKTYLDYEFEEIETEGLHHAFVELPDGTLAWGTKAFSSKEGIVELAPGASEPTLIWNVADDWPGVNGGESNGIFYSEDRDTYLYSFYTNNSVVEFNRTTRETLWWAGDVSNGYEFVPEESEYEWQHGISWTDAGTLLVSTEGRPEGGGAKTTWVKEYIVDDASESLTYVWGYDSGVRADTNGDTWRLDNGNTLHTVGSASQVKEVDMDGEVVWHVDFGNGKMLGRGEFIADLYPLLSTASDGKTN
jgi:hypothetical protein